ncbi:uncharacterized protein LOC26514413 [Drosophila ananassae]|uniref:uncharacterized protein LOC26514413 n=1 Tax=Drosophila ananassae TaxID=7217 RepID=UPI001CFF7BE7|nr:uncharacterized protein LOC26514413 [Drosophila ananassae]
MVTVTFCCYFFSLRVGCILSGLWLIIYYSALAFVMYSEIINPRFEKGKYWDTWGDDVSEDLEGYWVLGIAYLVMDFVSIFLIFGGIVKSITLLSMFLVLQIVPVSVKVFFMLWAVFTGLELESVITYLLPLIFLLYIDVVAYSYLQAVRFKKKRIFASAISIEY